MPQGKKFTVFVCVYGIVMCTVEWRVFTELWCLHNSGLCLWYSGVYSTMVCLWNSSVYITVVCVYRTVGSREQ